MSTETDALVRIRDVHAHFGASHVLRGVDLAIGEGEALGLLGRNGMGKTTLIRTLLGHVRATRGSIHVRRRDVTCERPDRIARLGIGYVPEGRGIFPDLTVHENLVVAARRGRDGRNDWIEARVFETFPRIAERIHHRGDQLSGGEQQMVAIGRALMSRPRLLLMDEPSMGLSPALVQQNFQILKEVHESGVAMLMVEQNANMALTIADRGYVLATGELVLADTAENLLASEDLKRAYLGR
jgi:branched-chain amino acid transport system ATP-binding protein